ncbi:hypothetical protein [Gracilibacillus xinjiangensis]|uniref:Uncharacterized protein n=1 Tax=Gracilibacillus xinjiangensis TaxID=1193282 RepID=A0ABV8WWQ2_9BACI
MKFSQKQQKNMFSCHHHSQRINDFAEFRKRDYQTEIAAQMDISLHSTQKNKKMQKPT